MASQAVRGASFRAFYREHWQGVLALCIAMTGDRSAAEDVTQEAFTKAYRNWEKVSGYDDPGAWVRRVASNTAISRWRKLRNEANAAVRLGNRPPPDSGMPEPQDRFWALVRELPRNHALALALHYGEDRSVKDIAAILDVKPDTAKAWLHRGRQALAAKLDVHEEVAP